MLIGALALQSDGVPASRGGIQDDCNTAFCEVCWDSSFGEDCLPGVGEYRIRRLVTPTVRSRLVNDCRQLRRQQSASAVDPAQAYEVFVEENSPTHVSIPVAIPTAHTTPAGARPAAGGAGAAALGAGKVPNFLNFIEYLQTTQNELDPLEEEGLWRLSGYS